MRRRRRGFTLVELMITVIIGAASVVLAAKVAQVVFRQSQKGREATNLGSRSRVVTRQIRADLRAAGVGSTGAVGVDDGVEPWATMNILTEGGFAAIPVVMGADGLVNSTGGVPFQPGTDAITLVVPNPGSAVRTVVLAAEGTNTLVFDPLVNLQCPSGMVYVADHTSPTGSGRTQILHVQAEPPNSIQTVGVLQFSVLAGAQVMCARVTTYWVDDDGWMHRSDLVQAAPDRLQGATGQAWVNVGNDDFMAPGMLDLQFAYRVSSELYGGPAPAGLPGRWAFAGQAGNADGLMGPDEAWREVRMVRFNVLARTLRVVQDTQSVRDITARENGPVPAPLKRAFSARWLTTAEPLTNQRLFDMNAAAGLPAEPY